MKHLLWFVPFAVGLLFIFLGCSARPKDGTPALPGDFIVSALPVKPAPDQADTDNDAAIKAGIVVSLDPELAEIIATVSDPMIDRIDTERMRSWRTRAELRLQVELLSGERDYLQRLVALADEAEERYLARTQASSGTADDLRVFGLIRDRIARNVAVNARELATAQQQLQALVTP